MKTQTIERRKHLLGNTVDENEKGFINKYEDPKLPQTRLSATYFVFEPNPPWNLIDKFWRLADARKRLGIETQVLVS